MTRYVVGTLLASSSLLGVPAFAQASAPAASKVAEQLKAASDDPIIVTARRVEENVQDVPVAIAVYSQQQITARNITSISDLSNYTPSLSTNSRFGTEKANFAIRGFTQEFKTAPSVGVYFADVVGIRSNSGSGGGNGAGVGQMFDLQNVQVLKGPQGTLFGRNTTGGAILIVPKKPTRDLGGYLEGSVGNFDMHRVQGALNLPLSDTFRVRLGMDWQDRDGYLNNKSGIGPGRLGNLNYVAARLSIVGDLTPTLENYTIVNYSRSRTAGTVPRLALCNRPLAATPTGFLAALGCAQLDRQTARGDGYYDVENSIPDPKSNIEQWQVINTTTWEASDRLTVKNIISYGQYIERSSFSVFGDNYTVGGKNLPLTNIIEGPLSNFSQRQFTEELQFQGKSADDKLDWVAGGYAEISNPDRPQDQFTQVLVSCTNVQALACTDPIRAGSINNPHVTDKFRNYGVFAQGTYKFSPQFSITAGARYSWDRIGATAEVIRITFPNPGAPRFACTDVLRFDSNPSPTVFAPVIVSDRSQCHSEFATRSSRATWLISGQYQPNGDLLFYGKWARGYRAGGINVSAISIETWEPEKVDSYEVGAKTSFHGAVRGFVNLAAFYNDLSDQQISANIAPLPGTGLPPQQGILNAGKSRIWGIEADASVSPFAGLDLGLAYAYLNTKVVDINAPAQVPVDNPLYNVFPNSLKGDPLSLTPHNRVTVSAKYTLPLPESVGAVSFGANFVHTDEQNATSRASSPLFRLPATDLLNLDVTWQGILGMPVDASFFATNVTKQKYFIFGSGGYTFFGVEGYNPGLPRMFGARLRYRFGG